MSALYFILWSVSYSQLFRSGIRVNKKYERTVIDVHRPASRRNRGRRQGHAGGRLFTRLPKPDFAFALHANGAFAYGTVRYTVGIDSSAADGLYIKFRGRGGHGAVPQATIDPVMMAGRFIVDVQSVISREKDPTEFGVVSIGTIHGGTAVNIIPDDVVLAGTIRSFKPEVRARMLAGIERTAKAVAAMSNAPEPEIKITEGIKAVINDPGVVATAEKVLKPAFGDKFRLSPPVTPSEDYSEFINAGDVLQNRRLRAAARRCRPRGRRSAATGQPLAPVRAGAEADHRDGG
jgi:metal-dependent amidase/aminoacylase/carboxypeptidase family protein